MSLHSNVDHVLLKQRRLLSFEIFLLILSVGKNCLKIIIYNIKNNYIKKLKK